MCLHQVVNETYGDSVSLELDDLPLHGEFQMAEFAKKYFREAQRNRRSLSHMITCCQYIVMCPFKVTCRVC